MKTKKNLLGVADYGMDVWFGGNFCLEERLDHLREIGIDGLEWLKGNDSHEAFENAVTFHRMGMDFASCSINNNFELTVKCAAAFGKEYVWIPCVGRDVSMENYLRSSNYAVECAARYGIKTALHNHLGARIENRTELQEFMEKVPGAYLLLDIAHAHAADCDNVEIVKTYHDRLAAIHFKDIYYKDRSIGLDRSALLRTRRRQRGSAFGSDRPRVTEFPL